MSRLRNFRFKPFEEKALARLRERWGLRTDTQTVKVAILACLDRPEGDIDPDPFLEELK